jgi:rare lipoprotein A
MKRLAVVFMLCLLSVYGFGQSQMGEASYNASKSGFTISHSSMSFGTRVRVINLTNNSEVIAPVDSRIPASDPRVADISREAGDAIGMARTGHTMVRVEQLVPPQPAAFTPAPAPPPSPELRGEIIQVVTPSQVQYIPAPVAEQVNCPLFPAVIFLLALVAALLAAILVLLICARRFPWWYAAASGA